jgi:hypothetical protein
MNHIIQNKLGQDSKSGPTKYEAGVLISTMRHWNQLVEERKLRNG